MPHVEMSRVGVPQVLANDHNRVIATETYRVDMLACAGLAAAGV